MSASPIMTDGNCWPPERRLFATLTLNRRSKLGHSRPALSPCNKPGYSALELRNRRGRTMRFNTITAALALAAGLGVGMASADAAPRQKVRIVEGGGQTVYSYIDENGRRRTRVIIQRRSYLDPGTAALPSDRRELDYVQ